MHYISRNFVKSSCIILSYSLQFVVEGKEKLWGFEKEARDMARLISIATF